MCDQRNQDSPHGAVNARRLVSGAPASNRKKRRHFLKSSALLITGAIGAGLLPAKGLAQIAGAANADLELARLRGQRRILLRGGVVLTLDRQIGDFTQADVLIDHGKIREVRPNITVSATSLGSTEPAYCAWRRTHVTQCCDAPNFRSISPDDECGTS